MKDQTLDTITPISISGTLLFTITSNIEKLFDKKEIKFQIKIKNNKLILESPEIITIKDFQDNIPVSEAVNAS